MKTKMTTKVFKQYKEEKNNWLKRGRRRLFHTLLQEVSKANGITKPLDLDILEVGSGVGQNIPTLQAFGRVEVIEFNPIALAELRAIPGIAKIYETPIPFNLNQTYDVVCALDVVEHIEDDRRAVQWLTEHLKPGGHLIVTLPAYQWLFSDHDIAVGHYRRYTKQTLNGILPTELVILKSGYFNSVLFIIPAAIRLTKCLLKHLLPSRYSAVTLRKESSNVPGWLDSIFANILLVETKIIEKKPMFPFGLSVFCMAKKNR
jgi:2-polyprenyl-3-methyl-5-hydroxy-6-metoxy-1,4-benzoquinol methylase